MKEQGGFTIIFEELDRLQSETEELNTRPSEVEVVELEAISELREIVSEASEVPDATFTST